MNPTGKGDSEMMHKTLKLEGQVFIQVILTVYGNKCQAKLIGIYQTVHEDSRDSWKNILHGYLDESSKIRLVT